MLKKRLVTNLNEIATIIERDYSDYRDYKNTGLHGGLSGIALFQFYYSQYTGKKNHQGFAEQILSDCIDKFEGGDIKLSFCNGATGMGWLIDHLEEKSFIEINSDVMLCDIEKYIFQQMKYHLKNDELDFLHTGLGNGYYFYKRYLNTKSNEKKKWYKEIIETFIVYINKKIDLYENYLNKVSFRPNLKNKEINLSYAHGVTSILHFVSSLGMLPEFHSNVKQAISKFSSFIISYMNLPQNTVSLFPDKIFLNDTITMNHSATRLGWCYGDIGVGLSIRKASLALDDSRLCELSAFILTDCAGRKSTGKTMVMDSCVCHGNYGNSLIFGKLYVETGENKYKKASNYWLKKGINERTKSELAGYQFPWYNRSENKGKLYEYDLLYGLPGIGLSILSYLNNYNSTWEECLMIT